MDKKTKFREKILESGIKILLGKNAEQNEELVNKFTKKNYVMLHTEKPGSPFCVIIENAKTPLPIMDIKEAATYCARYSQDWRDNKKDVKVQWFDAVDVYKKKGMPIGTFGVKFWNYFLIKKKYIKELEK